MPRIRSRALLAWLSLGLALLAPFAWVGTLDHPFLRSTGAAAWTCLALSLALGVMAVRTDRRKWVRGLFLADLVIAAGLLWGAFGFARLPSTDTAQAMKSAPDFTLVDHTGRTVNLAHELEHGPVLLVFFRGSW